jgi:hypothetical protein
LFPEKTGERIGAAGAGWPRSGHLIRSGADREYEAHGVEVLFALCHGARSRTASRAANSRRIAIVTKRTFRYASCKFDK